MTSEDLAPFLPSTITVSMLLSGLGCISVIFFFGLYFMFFHKIYHFGQPFGFVYYIKIPSEFKEFLRAFHYFFKRYRVFIAANILFIGVVLFEVKVW